MQSSRAAGDVISFNHTKTIGVYFYHGKFFNIES